MVVATIIIVVITTISFFLASSGILNEGRWDLNDKQKDFVVTKSVTNFVEKNFDLIESSVVLDDYDLLEKKSEEFLEIVGLSDKWNIDFFVDEDRKFRAGL